MSLSSIQGGRVLGAPGPCRKPPPFGTMPRFRAGPPAATAARAAATPSPDAPNSMLRMVAGGSRPSSPSAGPSPPFGDVEMDPVELDDALRCLAHFSVLLRSCREYV